MSYGCCKQELLLDRGAVFLHLPSVPLRKILEKFRNTFGDVIGAKPGKISSVRENGEGVKVEFEDNKENTKNHGIAVAIMSIKLCRTSRLRHT